MIGTIVVRIFGGPIHPSAFGPSHPCAPVIHTTVTSSPASVSSTSEGERRNRKVSAAITSSATPINRSIVEPVAASLSSSIVASETLRPASGPSTSSVISWMASSAATSVSMSPGSRSRMVAIATGVPSASVPVSASNAARCPASPPSCAMRSSASSSSACVMSAKPSTPSTAASSSVGEATASPAASTSATRGSDVARSITRSICASPSGVSTSPRKSSVTDEVSADSPNSVSIFESATATSLSSERKISLSACGARCGMPAPSAIVMAATTTSVTTGRTVTSQLSPSSTLPMARHSHRAAAARQPRPLHSG